jgi:hypothetical protein
MMQRIGFRRKLQYAIKGEFFFDCWTPEDGSDRLFHNVRNKLEIYAA